MIGTYLNLSVPLLSDNLATIVSKTATALGQLRDSIADKATPSALTVSSALSFGGNWATSVGGLTLADGNNPTAAGSIYYHNGEFYAIDSTATMQLTNNGQLNVSSFGGIGGDYGGANPALVKYVTASSVYRFYVNPNTPTWADISGRNLILNGALGTLTLQPSATQTGSVTVTWLTALPSTTKGLAVDNAGNIATLDSVTRTVTISPWAAVGHQFGANVPTFDGIKWTPGDGTIGYPLALPVGAIITGWRIYANKSSSNTTTMSAQLLGYPEAGGAHNDDGILQSNSANAPGAITFSESGITHTVASDHSYILSISSGGGSTDASFAAQVDYKFYL